MEDLVRTVAFTVYLNVLSIVVAGCASEPAPPAAAPSAEAAATSPGMHGGTDHGTGWSFGEPGEATDADRMVDVEALDTLRFDPPSISASVGDTITFVLTNAGEVTHEFVLGDPATQDQHQGEMGEMSGSTMLDEANAVTVAPAEEKVLTWTFTEDGTVLYACHVDDHYAGGMVGEIRVR